MSEFLKIAALRDCLLFQNIESKLVDRALERAKFVEFPEPTDILQEGKDPTGMYVIVCGHVGASITVDAQGQSNLVRAGSSDLLGDVEAIARQPCLATCRTEANCKLLHWSMDVVDFFVETPEFARNLTCVFYNRLSIINHVRRLEHSTTVDMQIANCLLRMSARDPLITQSQSFIAESVGCSRQTVNRILGQLRDANIISLRKAKIEVHDRDRLECFFAQNQA